MGDTPSLQPTSSASRLRDLLGRLRKADEGATVVRGWAVAAGVDPDDRAQALRAMADAILLVQQVRADILQQKDVAHALYERSLTKLEHIIAETPPSAALRQLLSGLDQALLQGIEFCADRLERVSGEVELDDTSLASLLAEVERLQKAVLSWKIHNSLQIALVAKLEEMRRAILSYRLFGPGPLRAAADGAIGAIWLAQDEARQPSARKEMNQFLELVVKVQTVVARAISLGHQVPGVIFGLLGPGGSCEQPGR